MIFALVALLAIGFPALALWARRTGGTRRLMAVAGAGLAAIIVLALAGTSSALGNRLADSEGYWALAPRVVLFGLLAAGLPVITMTLVVEYMATRVAQATVVHGVATLAALVALGVGVTVAMSMFWR